MGVAYSKRRREDMTVINCKARSFFKKRFTFTMNMFITWRKRVDVRK